MRHVLIDVSCRVASARLASKTSNFAAMEPLL
jgi:hypothetical protein